MRLGYLVNRKNRNAPADHLAKHRRFAKWRTRAIMPVSKYQQIQLKHQCVCKTARSLIDLSKRRNKNNDQFMLVRRGNHFKCQQVGLHFKGCGLLNVLLPFGFSKILADFSLLCFLVINWRKSIHAWHLVVTKA